MVNNYHYIFLLVSLIRMFLLVNDKFLFAIDSEYLRGIARDTNLNKKFN